MVLKVVASHPGLHGYGIMTRIRVLSDEVLRVEEGSLYPALHRLEEAGFLKARWIVKDNGRRARSYRLTAAGERHLAAETKHWQETSAAVTRVLGSA